MWMRSDWFISLRGSHVPGLSEPGAIVECSAVLRPRKAKA